MTYYENLQRRRKKRRLAYMRCFTFLAAFLIIVFGSYKFFEFINQPSPANEEAKTESNIATKAYKNSDAAVKKENVEEKAEKNEIPLTGNVRETPAPHNYSVLINKGKHKIYLLDRDEKVAVWGCAIGKGGAGQKTKSGDNMTPNGNFFIEEINDASYWTHDFKDGKGEIKGAYGPYFLSLDTNSVSKGKWDGIGIHGTHDPESIGTNASEGCIRMNNNELLQLKKYVKVNTKVVIEE